MPYEFGRFSLDESQRLLLRDGAIVPLTPKLVETLIVLAEAGGRVVTRDALITRVWPDTAVTDSSLTQNIWLLRRALEHDGDSCIETLSRRGYRLTLPVTHVAPAATAPAHAVTIRPKPMTSLVGRSAELRELTERIQHERLVTLTGPGGAGKTRLALEATERLESHFADGVTFVDLSWVEQPADVSRAVARALGLDDEAGRSPDESVIDAVSARHCLLVLDNFEQVLPAADWVGRLAASSPETRILVTSRAPLRLSAERTMVVAPLSLPDADLVAPDRLRESEAVALFVERVRQRRPSFALTAENAAAIARICRRLDGLPLALELAASRMRAMSPAHLDDQLADSALALAAADRDASERQRTLAATLAWSHRLLSREQQTVFAELAVFRGTFSADAMTAVTGGTIEQLQELVESSLVEFEDGPDAPRFRLLNLVRAFALDALGDGANRRRLERAHADHFAAVAAAIGRAASDQERRSQYAVGEADRANFAAAAAVLHASAPDAALTLAVDLAGFRHMRGHWQESLDALDHGLAAAPDAADVVRAEAFLAAGRLRFFMGDESRDGDLAEAVRLARRAGQRALIARALDARAQLKLKVGALDDARNILEEAVALARASGDAAALAGALITRGTLQTGDGAYAGARTDLEEGARFASRIGDRTALGRALYSLAGLALLTNDVAGARRLCEEATDVAAQSADSSWRHHVNEMRGRALIADGRSAEGAPLVLGSLADMDAVGSRSCLPHGLDAAARLALAREDVTSAAVLLGAASAICEQLGVVMLPIERALYQQTVARLGTPLPPMAVAGWEEGRRRSAELALEFARTVCAPPTR